MFRRSLKIGDCVRIDAMATVPAYRRIYRVTGTMPGDTVKVTHVSSGADMEIADHACELLPDKPVLSASLDCFVGLRVRVNLVDGTRLHGTCTGVMYHEVDLRGERFRQVLSLELDGSQGTTYEWSRLKSVESI